MNDAPDKNHESVTTIQCSQCERDTKHVIAAAVRRPGSDDVVSWEDVYEVLECRGCGHVTFRKRLWFSEWQDWNESPNYRDEYFPPVHGRAQPGWMAELPERLGEVLRELYVALSQRCLVLATIGARTALDIAIVDKIGDIGSFDAKLRELEHRKLVSPEERRMLETVTEAGNAAAHRGYAPDENDLNVVVNILEELLEDLYIRDKRRTALAASADTVRRKVPPRPEA